jgi:hypothetical protein
MPDVALAVTAGVNIFGVVYSGLRLNLSKSASPPIYFGISLIVAIALCVLRHYSTKHLFEPLGRRIIRSSDKNVEAKISKFGSCSFKGIFFIAISLLEYSILSRQEFTPSWLFGRGNTAKLWTEGYDMPLDLITLFMGSLGYHLHSTIYHCFFVERRGDFGEMLLHHTLTLWLMVLSYIDGYSRIGLLIVFLNDVPDIFVYLTKSLGDTIFLKSSIAAYVGLLFSYGYFRLVVFPVSLLPSLLYESNFSPLGRYLYIGFLCCLTLLHAHWFLLLVRIGVNLATTGSRRDITVERQKQA